MGRGSSLQPVRRLTCPTWQAGLQYRDQSDLSRRNLSAYQGCLLGAAAGDALGAAVNDSSLSAIRACYGYEGIQDLSPAFGRLGAVTAHTQMALFTGEGLIRAEIRGNEKGICHPPSVVHHAYARWMLTQGERAAKWPEVEGYPDGWLVSVAGLRAVRRPSKTVIEALRQSEMGTRERPPNTSKGCSALARIAPVGLTDWNDAFPMGCEIGALTHGHLTAYLAAGFLAALVEALVRGGSLRGVIAACRESLRACPGSDECLRAVDGAMELAEQAAPTPESVERLGKGWRADEALAISLFCSLAALSFEEGVRLAVNHSGDSDTTGGVTGAILGTIHGREAIPERWQAPLELRAEIETLATELYLEFGNCPYAAVLGASDWPRYPGW